MRTQIFVRWLLGCTFLLMTSAAALHALDDGFAIGTSQTPDGTDLWRFDLDELTVEKIQSGIQIGQVHATAIDTRQNVFCILSATAQSKLLLSTYDLETGELRQKFNAPFTRMAGVVYNPVDGLLYGLAPQASNLAELRALDPTDGSIRTVGEVPGSFSSAACTGALDVQTGHYYRLHESGNALKIDITSAEVVQNYGKLPHYYLSQFDPITGLLYCITGHDGSGAIDLLSFDPASAEFTVVADNILNYHRVQTCSRGFDVKRGVYIVVTPDLSLVGINRSGEIQFEIPTEGVGTLTHLRVYQDHQYLATGSVISGKLVTDVENGNCIPETSDLPMARQRLHFTPGNYRAYTNSRGEFKAYLPADSYQIELDPNSLWRLTCNDDQPTIQIEALADAEHHIDLTLEAKRTVSALETSVSSSRAIAGREIIYDINFRNVGTVAFTGTLQFFYDQILTDFAAQPNADRVTPGLVEWDLTNIPIGASHRVRVTLNIPAVETLRGTEICARVNAQRKQSDILLKHSSDETCIVIRGSYDPNDIAVHPHGFGERGLITAEDSTLAYTIRFQNIGDAPARDVIIRDTLSRELDFKSLHFGAASHEYFVNILDDNILEFRFEGIELPGKQEDEPGSHGQVKFKVDINRDLPKGTEISNRAAIYFDFNKAVITNTVVNTITETITDVSETVNTGGIELRSISGDVFSLHADASLNSQMSGQLTGQLSVYSVLGHKVLERELQSENSVILDLSTQPSGRYLVRIKSGDQVIVKSLAVLR